MLVQRTQDIGIDIQLRIEVKSLERRDKEGVIVVNTTSLSEQRKELDGKDTTHGTTFEADMVVHGARRVPDIEDLRLDIAGVEAADKKKGNSSSGIKVNEYLQSISNPSVYAAGDAAASGGLPLTPIATYEGEIVATNLHDSNPS
jgi:glutathione reductase (NADPH)